MAQKLKREYNNTYDNNNDKSNDKNDKRNKGPVFSPIEQHTGLARCSFLG